MSKKTTTTTFNQAVQTTETTANQTPKEIAQQIVNCLITKVNNALDNMQITEAGESKIALTLAIETLNAEIKAEEFVNIIACENPALEACKRGFIGLATVKTDQTTKKVSQGSKIEIIDLAEIQQESSTQITVDPMWGVYSEALNHAILNYIMEMQGMTEKSNRLTKFKVSNGAMLLGISITDMGTTDGIIKAIQKVVNTIIAGQTVTEKQANAFVFNYSKWGKAINGVSMATESNFRRQLMRIMYQLVNGMPLIAE